MKTILTSTAIAAIALFGVSASAHAACPDGASNYPGGVASFFVVDTSTAEFLTGESYASYDSDCHTPLVSGIDESTTGEIVDAGGGAGLYSHSPSITVGPNNSAFGNGSSVYAEETYTHPGADGILGNADDEQRTRIIPVSKGTAIGANSHVGHDHSTAVGADSQTDRDNQIALGTTDDEVTVRNLTTNTADKADTTGIVVHKADGTLASDGGRIQGEIDANTASNTAQDATLADHEGRITTNEGDIADLQSENASQQTEIDNNTAGVAANAATNATQQTQLDDHEGRIGNNESDIATNASGIAANKAKNIQQDNRLNGHGTRIGSLEAENAQQWNQINANSDAIAKYGVRLEDAEKSIAIATAMPDAWLSDSKSFGVFGSVGGTGNETAVGFAAIGRIDETWSINGKLGADVGFDQFGWQVGAGAQW